MPPTGAQLRHAILRNFGGMQEFDPYEEFKKQLPETISQAEMSFPLESVCFFMHRSQLYNVLAFIFDHTCSMTP